MTSGGYIVNGVKLTTSQYSTWKSAGSPSSSTTIKTIANGTYKAPTTSTKTSTSSGGSSTSSTSTAPKTTTTAAIDYTKSPNETIDQYNARIEAARAGTTTAPTTSTTSDALKNLSVGLAQGKTITQADIKAGSLNSGGAMDFGGSTPLQNLSIGLAQQPQGTAQASQTQQQAPQASQGAPQAPTAPTSAPTGSQGAPAGTQAPASSMAPGTAPSTPTPSGVPEYVNLQGAYFRQTQEGLAAVDDPTIIKGLKTGAIPSTKAQEMPGAADSFASVVSSQAGPTLVQSYSGMANTFGLPPPQIGQSQFLNDPISFISQMTTQINKAMGLDQASSEITKITKEYEKLQNKKDAEIRDINDNPWLTEGVRLRQIQKTEEKYSDEEGNMTTRLQLLENVKKDATQQAQFALGTAVSLFDAERRFQAQQVQMYYDQAQRQFENQIALQELALKSQPEAMKPTSDMQEYMFAVEQGFNGGFLDYKAVSAAVTRAPSSGGGVNTNQMTDNERALFGQFRGEPIVKDYNTVLSQKLSVDNILAGKLGGPGDLAIVYEFMKGLDPTSVVRETEYEAAAKSGNIFAGALARYNGYLNPNGGFLPDNVKKSFQSIVDGKLKVKTQLYNNLTNEYRGLAQRQGLNPDNVAIGYNNAAQAPSGFSLGQIGDGSTQSSYRAPTQVFDNAISTAPETGGVFSSFINGLTGIFSR
jgi:hypothetical protein